MLLAVILPDSEVVSVDICISDTVNDVRNRVKEQGGFKGDFDLQFEGDTLTDDRLLSSYGIEPGSEVIVAVREEQLARSRLEKIYGASLDSSLLHTMIKNPQAGSSVDIFSDFFTSGLADPNDVVPGTCTTPLFMCVEKSRLDFFTSLLRLPNIDPNSTSSYNWSVIHKISQDGAVDFLVELLQHESVDVSARTDTQKTALLIAIEYDNFECVTELVSHGDVNVVVFDMFEKSPLNLACHNSSIALVMYLCSLPDIDFRTPDCYGNTPLHSACIASRVDVVRYLVSLPQNIGLLSLNEDGMSPYQIASLNSDTNDALIAKCLKSVGGSNDPDHSVITFQCQVS